MIEYTQMLIPLVSLIAWTLIIWIWMYATRIPAILKLKMELDPNLPSGQQMSELPANVRWKADNYNHLMEQPTIFYAVVFCLVLLEVESQFNLILAWGYVGLRIIHSLIHVLGKKVIFRFAVFFLSTLFLFGLTLSAIIAIFSN